MITVENTRNGEANCRGGGYEVVACVAHFSVQARDGR